MTLQEETMYEFCLSMKDMEKAFELIITMNEQGDVTVEDAYELVSASTCALISAKQLLDCMIEKQEKQG